MAVSIKRVKIRARITFGAIVVVTPNILSFNVRRSRGQASASFSASLKVTHDELSSINTGLSANIKIEAGENDPDKVIFTGYVYKVTINPSRSDSSYAIINISGKDIMSVMEGQTVTRRTPARQLAKWGAITSLLRKRDKFKERFPLQIRDSKPRLSYSRIMEAEDTNIKSPSPFVSDIDGSGMTGTAGRHSITQLPKEE